MTGVSGNAAAGALRVMTKDQLAGVDQIDAAVELLAQLAEEPAVIADLRGMTDRLALIADAKRQLAALPMAALREALRRRRGLSKVRS